MLKTRGRLVAVVAAVLLLVMAIAVVWAWQQRRGFAEQMIGQALAERDISPVSFSVSFIGLRSITLADVVVGDPASPDASIRSVTVFYSLGELISGRVRSIEIEEATGKITLSDEGLSLGALDPLLQGGGGSGALHVPPVEVDSARLAVGTPRGTFSISGPLSIRPEGDSFVVSTGGVLIREETESPRVAPLHAAGEAQIAASGISVEGLLSTAAGNESDVALIQFEGRYDTVAKSGVLHGEGALSFERDGMTVARLAPALAPYYIDLTGGVAYRAEARYDGETLAVDGEADLQDVALRQTAAGDGRASGRVSFSAAFGDGSTPYRMELAGLRVEDLAQPVRFAPVLIDGPVTLDGSRAEGKFVLRSAVPAIRGARLANIDAHFDLSKGEGRIRANGDLSFAPGRLEPHLILPVLGTTVMQVSGGLSYNADATLSRTALSTSGNATLRDVGLVTSAATLRGIDGELAFSRLVPPRTKGVQTITVRSIEAGVPLESGTIAFEADRDGIRLVDARWPFADGRLTLTSSGASVLADNTVFLLTVENVDLGKLLAIAEVPGLRATGHIGGRIPVMIRDGDPILVDGSLAALEKGVIVYRSEATDAAQTEQTKLLTDALRNFHYTELSGGLSGNANGAVVLRLSLRGSNPDLYEGYPFAINVNVEGSLADLFRHGTVGLRPLELIRQHPDAATKP
ncbi:MAG: YdbH domain-containing protein [Parvibaculum sp.]|nr:YdbH domain-containing protein [Parvibaculum sp.]